MPSLPTVPAATARRTNLGLLALLGAAFLSGGLAFGVGTGWAAWVTAAHGVAAVGVALLAPWKTAIARPPVERRRPGWETSALLGGLVVLALVTGVAHSAGLSTLPGGVRVMIVHVAAALVALPLAGWHVVARPVRPRGLRPSRREVLVAGGAVAGWLALEGVAAALRLPGARRRFTGSHETGSFTPAAMPVTQWLDDDVPTVDPDRWRLTVAGRAWSATELASAPTATVRATLDCTGGWYATQDWEGVPLAHLLPPGVTGRSIVVRSLTGYQRRFPPSDTGRLLVATRVGGAPLSPGHGFPARLVSPGRRGFWWVKWIDTIDVDDRPWWLQLPFPPT